ncbi:oxidoreductase [Cristinia sonorae]|uniref:Oxidoreductase n=1 Tax=Cristinia sonorae TaxID=1940300 RepID=A0A8K0UFJ0_9AGAR|nr:oxidoreductase [Cristinia sonorae]
MSVEAQTNGVHTNGVYKPWSLYMKEIFTSRTPPGLGSVNAEKLEQDAKEKLKDHPDAFMYVFACAGSGKTGLANRAELERWRIIPRMLRDVTVRNVQTTIFGVKHPSPVFLAPVGVQAIVHQDGESASAAAAAKFGIPYIMSGASSRTIEAVGKANGNGHRWYQMYWPRSDDITVSLLGRAKAAGFNALVLTLDTMLLGWRTHDIDSAYVPFIHGVGAQTGFSDPVFMARHHEPLISDEDIPVFPYDFKEIDRKIRAGDQKLAKWMKLGGEWIAESTPGYFRTWEDLKFVRQHWDGPIVLKGIQSVEDAKLAIEHGMEGIIVSNHGGRQIDGAIPSLYALRLICADPTIKAAQESGKLTVLFDSGIRTGSDIFKAIALGAQAVLVGRPFVFGLACGGQAGVEQVIKSINADLEITLGLSGHKNLNEIRGKADEVLVRLDL